MLPITPDVRIAGLLEAYPELEAVLMAQAPAFKALRNPVLRRTIARVTTIAQAARIGDVSARDLVRTLRIAVGQSVDDGDEDPRAAPDGETRAAGHACAHDRTRPATTLRSMPPGTPVLDADALLESGIVPLAAILDAASSLAPAAELRVLVAFRPAPIVERLEAMGFTCEFGLHDENRTGLRVSRRGPS